MGPVSVGEGRTQDWVEGHAVQSQQRRHPRLQEALELGRAFRAVLPWKQVTSHPAPPTSVVGCRLPPERVRDLG